ncbi:MAG TPA: hypothetical protein PK018_00720 [Candidatus Competibacter sp.]|nr:hypothetical protein [Candidatus Competibacteraceae bacterium]HPE70684.1 hypothetical protein [Candidatus Competibacter sp.]HRX71284.1 hypothetical protein [Candidatus Competibacteraceae bacterium]
MQPRILVAIFALSLSLNPTVLLAQQEQPPQGHEAHHPESTASTDETTASDPVDTGTSNDKKAEAKDSTDPVLASMQQHMQEILSHWDKMSQTTDPAQRQQLMLEHRQKMMALNVMMRNLARQKGMMGGQGMGMMGGQDMMGQGKSGGMMGMMRHHGGSSSCQAGWLEAYRQLEKRVDLLQKMVEEALHE